ncbi:MAG: hypothetical protein GY809_32525 [Planctomycetes bacterium]|nr:hypothetical protein [Planctomycetota bacterium]
MLIKHTLMALLWLCSLFVLGGCSASNHPMTEMVRMQREIMQDMANVLHDVDDVSDLEPAVQQMEALTQQMRRRLAQVAKQMDKHAVPKSRAEARRLQRAIQREAKKFDPIVKQMQREVERLSKQDWCKPLLEATSNAKFEFKTMSK